MRKIIVAGAGHGGLTAAAYLADKGYDVELYERNSREELGYDWDDAMHNKTFEYAGISEFDIKDVIPREKSGFFSTSMKTPILFEFSLDNTVYEIQRKVLYRYLLDNADKKGVKMFFNKSVDSAIIDPVKDKIIGIMVDGKPVNGDLVIDSAGMYSPVRNSLPKRYNINNHFKNNEVFYTYRALYNIVEGEEIMHADRFNIYLKFNNINGIAWFKVVDGLADVLIGSVKPINMDEVEIHLKELRKFQPCIGEELKRGGIIAHIPLRACFSKIVGDNYVAVGDVVSMVVPVNGSGITNSIRAGKFIADTVTNIDLAGNNNYSDYSEEKLWDYQVKYMKKVGSSMISIDLIKRCLLSYNPKVLDFFFDQGILSAKELKAGSMGEDQTLGFKDILDKVKRGYKKLPMLLRLSSTVNASKKAKLHALNIPCVYNESAIQSWRKKYESYLK